MQKNNLAQPSDQAGEHYQEALEDFDNESIILRRADPDDCDAIINLIEIGEDDIYNRVYAYPKILKLIETAYLAITVIDREGNVCAFAAFEDYPQGMRGMNDDKHFNYWEDWFRRAYKVEEFSAFNTLWLTYFIAGGLVSGDHQRHAFKQVLQTVYTSLPDLIGVLFLCRGDADPDDVEHCFGPIVHYFEKCTLIDGTVMANVRGIHRDSSVFFSSRIHVLPFIEVRPAKQEDHDDLADVFNSQSETVTEAYGEYFIAELIASQNDRNKALVAQVKDKAVGLMGLTLDVDVKLLHKCFELDSFDNLLKPEFMDAVRKRREHIKAKMQREEYNKKIEAQLQLRNETMLCNIVAQRISLQEYFTQSFEEISTQITDLHEMKTKEKEELEKNKRDATSKTQKVEERKETHTREFVEREFFGKWLNNFKLRQPNSKYFLEHQINDIELECNIQSELQFLISTLEMFGLPKDYMKGAGHHVDWDKNKDQGKGKAKGKKQTAAKKPAGGKNKKTEAMLKMRAKIEAEKFVKPEWFDLIPFKAALEKFVKASAEKRSEFRTCLVNCEQNLKDCFKDANNELSFKRIVDLLELKAKFQENHIPLNPEITDDLASILQCFGCIYVEKCWGERVPPETPEEETARKNLENREEKLAKLLADKDKDSKAKKQINKEEEKKRNEEEASLIEAIAKFKQQLKPKKPQKAKLSLTSLHDLLQSVEKMAEYDRTLSELGVIQFSDYESEDFALRKTKRPYIIKLVKLPPISDDVQYSTNALIQKKCEEINDLTTIPDPPESAKNGFAITLFCMEAAFDSRSQDFLKYAFQIFPDRDYLIVTQPHTVPENSLISKFTLVPKSAENTFSHVLYLIHRDYLLEQDIAVSKTNPEDLASIKLLISQNESEAVQQETMAQIVNSVNAHDSPFISFCARIYDTVVGTFLVSKDINLEYLLSHFHIQDQILLAEHERRGHSRLVYSLINPVFQKSARFMLKELLRLSGKTCLYFEILNKTVIPTIFQELVHIRSRRFPHFLERKWDHERFDPKHGTDEDREQNIPIDGSDRDPLDEKESPFALCFTTKRLLSEPKILKNSRIVVVGGSDAGISFIEALLSISYLHFSNITLVSPGGLPHHQVQDKKSNLKAYSTSYTNEELKKLMLESRINVIDARMNDVDRDDKNIVLHDGKVLPYDTLILTMGIQEKALSSLKYTSQGINPLPAGTRKCKGVLSIDDPYLYKFLSNQSTLMQQLTDHRRQTCCVVYGRTLHTYVTIQGLIHRGVKPSNIQLCIPRLECHVNEEQDDQITEDMPYIYPDAFEDDHEIEQKLQNMLLDLGVTITRDTKLIEIITDRSADIKDDYDDNAVLERVVFKRLDIPDEEEEEDEVNMSDDHSQDDDNASRMDDMDNLDDEDGENREDQKQKKVKRKKNQMELECRVLITCCHRDVDEDVFKSIHDNGLVYNGRLIVDRNFQTTDPSIFAAGSLCEFSNRYKSLSQGRSLRMDRYNGREIGSRLARSVFDIYDPNAVGNQPDSDQQADELPLFYLPQGQGGVLPREIIYYHIKTTNPMILKAGEQEKQNRDHLVCDNLDCSTGKGHFIKFTFNSIGLIDSVTYMGHEEVVLQSLWSFVGLHENYLNQLTQRHQAGIISNVVEFLSENWAIGLYHEWFGDFCLRMRQGIQNSPDVYDIIQKAQEKAIKERKGLSREQIEQLSRHLDSRTVKAIQDETLEFVKTNMNHLPMYYIPGEEFP